MQSYQNQDGVVVTSSAAKANSDKKTAVAGGGKKSLRVSFYKKMCRGGGSGVGIPGISVEASSRPRNQKPSIIKRETTAMVKFDDDADDDNSSNNHRHSAIPLFQNLQGAVGSSKRNSKMAADDDVELKANDNENNNLDGEALIYSNARFALKGLVGAGAGVASTSSNQPQFYGAVDYGGGFSPHFGSESPTTGGESDFPPLPACAVLPASAGVVKMASFSTAAHHSGARLQTPTDTTGNRKSMVTPADQQPASLSTSGSADSTASSGFVSASSNEQQQQQAEPTTASAIDNRKAFIVAKGILSAQAMASSSSSISPKFMRKKRGGSVHHNRQSSGEEMRYSIARSSIHHESGSECLGSSLNRLPLFKNPEYRDTSDEEDEEETDEQQQTPMKAPPSSSSLRKRPLKLFRSSHKTASRDKNADDDDFVGYDDDDIPPQAPSIVGWEEIEYTPLGSTAQIGGGGGGRSYDDIDVKRSFAADATSPTAAAPALNHRDAVTFLTLRPRGSRLRPGGVKKSWRGGSGGATGVVVGSPKPVPTPSLPTDSLLS